MNETNRNLLGEVLEDRIEKLKTMALGSSEEEELSNLVVKLGKMDNESTKIDDDFNKEVARREHEIELKRMDISIKEKQLENEMSIKARELDIRRSELAQRDRELDLKRRQIELDERKQCYEENKALEEASETKVDRIINGIIKGGEVILPLGAYVIVFILSANLDKTGHMITNPVGKFIAGKVKPGRKC